MGSETFTMVNKTQVAYVLHAEPLTDARTRIKDGAIREKGLDATKSAADVPEDVLVVNGQTLQGIAQDLETTCRALCPKKYCEAKAGTEGAREVNIFCEGSCVDGLLDAARGRASSPESSPGADRPQNYPEEALIVVSAGLAYILANS